MKRLDPKPGYAWIVDGDGVIREAVGEWRDESFVGVYVWDYDTPVNSFSHRAVYRDSVTARRRAVEILEAKREWHLKEVERIGLEVEDLLTTEST